MERRSFVSGLLGFLGLSAVAAKSEASSEPLDKFHGNVKSLNTSLATGNIEREKYAGELLECRRRLGAFGPMLLDPSQVVCIQRDRMPTPASEWILTFAGGGMMGVDEETGRELIAYISPDCIN